MSLAVFRRAVEAVISILNQRADARRSSQAKARRGRRRLAARLAALVRMAHRGCWRIVRRAASRRTGNSGAAPVMMETLEPRLLLSGDLAITHVQDQQHVLGDTAVICTTFTDQNPRQDYAAVVNWNDGSAPEAATVVAGENGYSIAASHTYAAAGVWGRSGDTILNSVIEYGVPRTPRHLVRTRSTTHGETLPTRRWTTPECWPILGGCTLGLRRGVLWRHPRCNLDQLGGVEASCGVRRPLVH